MCTNKQVVLRDLKAEDAFEWLGGKFRISSRLDRKPNHVPCVGPDNTCIHWLHDLIVVDVPKEWVSVELASLSVGEEFRYLGHLWKVGGYRYVPKSEGWVTAVPGEAHNDALLWFDIEVEVFR